MKKTILMILILAFCLSVVSCAKPNETSETTSEANHIKVLHGAVAKDKTGATSLLEVTKPDSSTLYFVECEVFAKGEFETAFEEKYGYSYFEKSNDGTDEEKKQAKTDRNALLDAARAKKLEALTASIEKTGCELVEGEGLVFVYDYDYIIKSHGYLFGVLVYATEDEIASLRKEETVLTGAHWKTAFYYNASGRFWELYELE